MKYHGTCTENLESSQEIPNDNCIQTEKKTTIQTWHRWSDNASCHASNALENHGSITDSHDQPCEWRPLMWFPDIYLPTLLPAKLQKRLQKSISTSWLNMPTCRRPLILTKDQSSCVKRAKKWLKFLELPYNMPQQRVHKQLERLYQRLPHSRKP